ncbi:MAG: hypothetical protein ABJE47_11840 [bacterium]
MTFAGLSSERVSGAFDTIVGNRKPVQPSEKSDSARMLSVPERGDTIAHKLWLAGVATYLLLASVLYGSLASTSKGGLATAFQSIIGYSQGHLNYSVLVLVLTGVALTIWAAFRLHTEIRLLRVEETDVEWVLRHKREGLKYVFEDADKREEMFRSGVHLYEGFTPEIIVETLIDDRVLRTHMVSNTGGRTSSEELRIIAERRTARWGATARYVSSLLLLLAVLGTFAGIKTALPPLIAAVGQSSGDTMSALQAPLEAVASAFGGNALALIGAIAVGLMAQGIAFGRRNLLERLELVSSTYIYGDSLSTSSDPMTAAVEMFTVSSKDFKEAAGAMTGIENGLASLAEEFSRSFTSLGERIAQVNDRSGEELYDRTGRNLAALQARVGELADAVSANAQIYAGLAPSLQYRAEETRAAFAEMDRTNRQLTTAMEMIGAASKSATNLTEQSSIALAQVSDASGRIALASEGTINGVTALARVLGQVQPAVSRVDSSLSQIANATVTNEKRLSEMWQGFAERIEKRLPQRTAATEDAFAPAVARATTGGEASPVTRTSVPPNEDVVRLLRQISEGIRDIPKPRMPHALWLTAGPITSVIVTAAIIYWLVRGRA